MRWVIISSGKADHLMTCLASAESHLPHVTPDILITDRSQETTNTCERMARRFVANWFPWLGRDDLLNLLESAKPGKHGEVLTLFTTDSDIFCNRVNLYGALAILNSHPDVRGVSLKLVPDSITIGHPPAMVYESRASSPWLEWTWPGAQGDWGLSFSFGTIYRTNDILFPVSRTAWTTPAEMIAAIRSEPLNTRRSRMACFQLNAIERCTKLHHTEE
jgi:hypothetical protein